MTVTGRLALLLLLYHTLHQWRKCRHQKIVQICVSILFLASVSVAVVLEHGGDGKVIMIGNSTF